MAASLALHLTALVSVSRAHTPATRTTPERIVTVQFKAATQTFPPTLASLPEPPTPRPAPSPPLHTKAQASTPAEALTPTQDGLWPPIASAIPYPVEGIDMSEESDIPGGRVRFQLRVDKNGGVRVATLLESTLDQPGSERLRQRILATRFVPAFQNGGAVDAETMLEITFGIAPPPTSMSTANE